jgi:hypothetical protein
MDEKKTCPICEEEIAVGPYRGGSYDIDCIRCGRFSLTDLALPMLPHSKELDKANLSGWIREHQGCKIFQKDFSWLAQLRTPSVAEKGDKLLNWFAKVYPKAGTEIGILRKNIPSSAEIHCKKSFTMQTQRNLSDALGM